MMIYFHPRRFQPEFSDCLKVPSLDAVTTAKGGGEPMPTDELLARWLVDHPEGSITITAEVK